MNPEIYSHLMPTLFKNGALDVYLTNIIMKKNRPGVKVNILCNEDKVKVFEDLLFRETTTLGVRKFRVDRSKLDRQFIKIDTKYGKVSIKVAFKNHKVLKYSPEFEECRKISENYDVPVKDIYNEILMCANAYFNNIKE